MRNKTLTWVHLSDLHYREKTVWDSDAVIQALYRDINTLLKERDLQPQLLFFTGDIAFGEPISNPNANSMISQYNGAQEILAKLTGRGFLNIPKHSVFLVPGNHDVFRPIVNEDETDWLINCKDSGKINAKFADRNDRQIDRYLARLKFYRQFLEENSYDHLLEVPERLFYSVLLEDYHVPVRIVGLNTAWSCCRNDEKGQLWMAGRNQIGNSLINSTEDELRIALLHHPPNWLTEYEETSVSRELESRFAVALHGHEHAGWISDQNRHIRISSGACYQGSQKPNVYSVGEIDLESGDCQIHLRCFSVDTFAWGPYSIPNRTTAEGIWSGAVQMPRTQAVSRRKLSPVLVQSFEQTSGAIAKLRRGPDIPPLVSIWVPREQEQLLKDASNGGVIAVTGMGGHGKSSLVAHHLTQAAPDYWDWRDCHEQSNRFHTQLVSMIVYFTEGATSSADLKGATTKELVRLFFELTSGCTGVIVLDNVDTYVNVDDQCFLSGVHIFVEEALKSNHSLTIILTCRPRISYASPEFTEISLGGFTLPNTEALFNLRKVHLANLTKFTSIEEIWRLTDGHPLWLNLIAVQLSRNSQSAKDIIGQLKKGSLGSHEASLFRALYAGLTPKQQTILRMMSELTYPETVDLIFECVEDKIATRNQFNGAFRGLVTLSLVVQRQLTGSIPYYDLHPLIRGLLRRQFGAVERVPFIDRILSFFEKLFGVKGSPSVDWSIYDLMRWSNRAELIFEAGNVSDSLEVLTRASEQLIANGLHEELLRVGSSIFDRLDVSREATVEGTALFRLFEQICRIYCEFDSEQEARALIDKVSTVITPGTVDYIVYCRALSYLEWVFGNFDSAISWARSGQDVKRSGIDTELDCSVNLALALRDSGRFDEALEIFCEGHSLSEVLSSVPVDDARGHSFFGNIGRCLFLKGNVKDALRCYAKSLFLLNAHKSSLTVLNTGYACMWIGEALEQSGQLQVAHAFFCWALECWLANAPVRVPLVTSALRRLEAVDANLQISRETRNLCNAWLAAALS